MRKVTIVAVCLLFFSIHLFVSPISAKPLKLRERYNTIETIRAIFYYCIESITGAAVAPVAVDNYDNCPLLGGDADDLAGGKKNANGDGEERKDMGGDRISGNRGDV